MRVFLGLFCGLFAFLFAVRSHALDSVDLPGVVGSSPSSVSVGEEEYPDSVLQELLREQLAIAVIDEMGKLGEITPAQQNTAVDRHLAKAREVAGKHLTVEAIAKLQSQTSRVTEEIDQEPFFKRVLGLDTFMGIVLIIVGIIGIICLIIILVKINLPVEFYEAAGYALSGFLLIYGNTCSESVRDFVTFPGAFLGCGMLVASIAIHRLGEKFTSVAYFSVITVFLATCAILTHNSITGFVTAIALMSALGFSVITLPGCYVIGFDDRDGKDKAVLARATSAGFLLILVFGLLRVLGSTTSAAHLFESGALWMGSFVGYLGLLIASSRWYDGHKNYILKQVVVLMAGVGALFFGSVFGISELQKIGGTFFVLWMVEKFLEIPAKSLVGHCTVGLVTCGWVYIIALFIKAHLGVLAPYLLWS